MPTTANEQFTRTLNLSKRISAARDIDRVMAMSIINMFRHDHDLMAELMAVCALPGPPPPNGHMTLCYYEGRKLVQGGWFGSGLVTIEAPTHHLPFPNAPSSA